MKTDDLPHPTSRLRLRLWKQEDRPFFRRMNADPRVMAYFPAPLNTRESDTLMDRICAHQQTHGFCFWAVEHRETEALLGFTGLAVPSWEAPFTPCVEIGWRFAHDSWGQGYATEAARAALTFGFSVLTLKEVVSFTASVNLRSQRVMQRLEMQTSPEDDFNHPALPQEHPLSRHVLYRKSPLR